MAIEINERTHKDIGSIAAKGLRGETLSPADIKRVCASALAQMPRHLRPGEVTDDGLRPHLK
jgi:hypothetical protein